MKDMSHFVATSQSIAFKKGDINYYDTFPEGLQES